MFCITWGYESSNKKKKEKKKEKEKSSSLKITVWLVLFTRCVFDKNKLHLPWNKKEKADEWTQLTRLDFQIQLNLNLVMRWSCKSNFLLAYNLVFNFVCLWVRKKVMSSSELKTKEWGDFSLSSLQHVWRLVQAYTSNINVKDSWKERKRSQQQLVNDLYHWRQGRQLKIVAYIQLFVVCLFNSFSYFILHVVKSWYLS